MQRRDTSSVAKSRATSREKDMAYLDNRETRRSIIQVISSIRYDSGVG